MYEQENDEYLPDYSSGPWGSGRSGGWVWYDAYPVPINGNFDVRRGTMYAQVGDARVYVCPADETGSRCSYGANYATKLRRRSTIRAVSYIPLLLEETAHAPTSNDGYFVPYDRLADRHNRGSLYLFCDGRVEWAKATPGAVWALCALK